MDKNLKGEVASMDVMGIKPNYAALGRKGAELTKFIQLAYLTGILPIKKGQPLSALNNFEEFIMLDASVMALYVGFTEIEDAVIMNINIVSEIYFLNSSIEH